MRLYTANPSLVEVHELVRTAPWAKDVSLIAMAARMERSLNVGIRVDTRLIAYARIVTDYFDIAHLLDVVVHEDHRGRGHGKELLQRILVYLDNNHVKRVMLHTQVPDFYKKLGFRPVGDNVMERKL